MEKKKKFFLVGLIAILLASVVGNLYFIFGENFSRKEVLSEIQNCIPNRQTQTANRVPNIPGESSSPNDQKVKPLYKNSGPEPMFVKSSTAVTNCITVSFLSSFPISKAQCSISPATKITAHYNGTDLNIYGEFTPGKNYTVRVFKGASNTEGGTLDEDAVCQVKIENLAPSISFASFGGFLPYKKDHLKIPFRYVNLDKVSLEIKKSFNNNLHVYNDLYYSRRNAMETVYSGELKLNKILNKEIYSYIDLTKLLKNPTCGAYLIKLNSDELNVFVTDIGLQAAIDSKNSKILVFLRSLTTHKAIPGAKVYAKSAKNQIVASGVTTLDGSVMLSYRPDFNAKDDYVTTITAINDKDIVLMKLSDSKNYYTNNLDSYDKDTPNAFVFAERGVARPGEDIECFAYIKKVINKEPIAMKNLPFILTLVNNSGEVVGRTNVTSDNYGFVKSSFKIPASALTGTYSLYCYLAGSNKPCGNGSILVANYVPDIIKVEGKDLSTKEYLANKEHKFSFSGNYYFGAPLINSRCNVSVIASPQANLKFWDKSWSVGCPNLNEKVAPFSQALKKDKNDVVFTYPGFTAKVYQPYKLIAQASMAQPGGRSVTNSVVKTVHPTNFYIGLREVDNAVKKTFEYTLLPAVEADYVNLETDLEIEFSLVKKEWDFALVQNGSYFTRKWIEKSIPLTNATRTVKLKKGKHLVSDIKTISWTLRDGEYDIIAKSNCSKIITLKNFYNYYNYSNERSGNPNVLTLKSNKVVAIPGEEVELSFTSSVKGEAFIALVGTELEGKKIIPVNVGTNKVKISIPKDLHISSYYASVTVIGTKNGSFIRNFGVAQINVNQKKNHQIKVDVNLPKEVRPSTAMPVEITLKDNNNNPVSGKVLLYAVDSGVTALSNYKAPNIFDYFYGKKASPVDFYDLYSNIMEDLKITPDGRIGGDRAVASKLSQIKNAQCAKVISQVVDVPVSGKVNVNLTLPEHTGALDVFAVAVSEDKVGANQNSVILRNPISVKVASPRFLAPKDVAEIAVTVFNHKLASKNFSVKVDLPKVIAIHKGDKTTFSGSNLAPGAQQTFTFRVCAKDALDYGKIVTSFTMDNVTVKDEQYLTVRATNVYQKLTNINIVKPGESLTINHDNLFIGNAQGKVKISNNLAISTSSALDWLNSYPYGCLEQTCAGAFPYLSLDLLVKGNIITKEIANTNKYKVRHAVNMIKSMAISDGSFAMWPGHYQTWLDGSLFAYHFIFEAINKKFIKPYDVNLYIAYNYLRRIAQDCSNNNRNKAAYATYILSLMGDKTAVSCARNIIYRSTKHDFALFLAGAALVKSNYATLGSKVILDAIKGKCYLEQLVPLEFSNDACRLGMMIYILIDCGLKDIPELTTLAYSLSSQVEQGNNVWGTTQANAWAVLGLAAYASINPSSDFSVKVATGNKEQEFKSNSIVEVNYGSPVIITNTSNKQIIVESILSGIPKEQKAENTGVKITKEILNQSGEKVTSANVGDLLTVRLTVNCPNFIDNLVIADKLPGCFEIEDSLLATRAISVSSQLASNYSNFNVKRFEKGDDSYIVSGDAFNGKTTFSYNVRVIGKGRFFIPITSAEAMYNANLNGLSNKLGFFVSK